MSTREQTEYENKLRVAGHEHIGGGMYANVFAKPGSDKVIKVGSLDDWPTYIKWATEKGYAGTFAPKVYSLKFFDDYYVAVMERLVTTIDKIKEEYGWHRSQNTTHVQLYNEAVRERKGTDATDLEAFIKDLRSMEYVNFDLHDGNVMVRHDGQIVVTDPISGGFSSERFRIKHGAIWEPKPNTAPKWYGERA